MRAKDVAKKLVEITEQNEKIKFVLDCYVKEVEDKLNRRFLSKNDKSVALLKNEMRDWLLSIKSKGNDWLEADIDKLGKVTINIVDGHAVYEVKGADNEKQKD